ncbi:MAG TPA: cupin domain-containing protein [Solirubrobacteraceae bacterium]|jgi:mannose-6-phosphate isomerase-like protein (cupin superfamily)
MAEDEVHEVVSGDGYAVGNIDALGEGGGFRKIRPALGVQALGINVIVMPAEFAGRRHYHYEQEETYFIHQGQAELEFGDGSVHRLGPGGVARIDPATVRRIRNAGANELIYLAVGGKDGYVENDGHLLPSEETA